MCYQTECKDCKCNTCKNYQEEVASKPRLTDYLKFETVREMNDFYKLEEKLNTYETYKLLNLFTNLPSKRTRKGQQKALEMVEKKNRIRRNRGYSK